MLTGAELDAVAGSGIWWDESNFAHADGDYGGMEDLGSGVYSLHYTDSGGSYYQYFYPNGDSYITMNGLVVWSN
jgi:hypothetical protein